MAGTKIKLKDQLGRVVRVGGDAKGATVGKDLRWPDGSLVKVSDIRNPSTDTGSTGGMAATVWKLIREIPANIQKLAKLAGAGFTTRGPDGEWYQRSIEAGAGINVVDGDGVAGNPTIGLGDLPDTGGGALKKIVRDAKGRVSGTSDPTTDDLPEGVANLYYTDERAAAAAPVQSVNGKTGDVVLDASDVGADASGAAAAAVADHVAAPDPHPQYTTVSEAAAAAPVQSVNAKTGAVSLNASDVGAEPVIAAGTTAQLYRGDKTWANNIMGDFGVGTETPVISGPGRSLTVTSTDSSAPISRLNLQGARAATTGNFAAFSAVNLSSVIGQLTVGLDGAADAGVFNITTRTAGGALANRLSINSVGTTAPGADNSQSLGAPGSRWKDAWVASGAISPSDAREKTQVRPLTAAEIAAAKALGNEIGVYQWLTMISKKGEAGARLHVGMTVQRAIEVMESHGLDPMRYGFICYDAWDELPEIRHEWPATPQVIDDFGRLVSEAIESGYEIVQPYRAAGDRYSFRMDELLAFIAHGMASRLDAIEHRLSVAGL